MDSLPQRKYIRLREYDYSQAGYYFITVCTLDKRCILWNVGETFGGLDSGPQLSKIGKIINEEIKKVNGIYDNIKIAKYVIMPNHLHLVIVIDLGLKGNTKLENIISGPAKLAPTISRVIQQFKGSISKQVGFPIWQKSFYDRVIRDEQEYVKILEYIETNPLRWQEDEYWRD